MIVLLIALISVPNPTTATTNKLGHITQSKLEIEEDDQPHSLITSINSDIKSLNKEEPINSQREKKICKGPAILTRYMIFIHT